MQNEKDIQLLQMASAAVLADATAQFAKENVLQNVTQRKKAEQIATGKMKAEHFGITSPEAVFTRLAEIFNCAAWRCLALLGKFRVPKRHSLPRPRRVNYVPLPRG